MRVVPDSVGRNQANMLSLPKIGQDDPAGDARDMDYLVAGDEYHIEVRGLLAPLEHPDPPLQGYTGVNQDVDEAEREPSLPTEYRPQKQGMDATMNPRGRVAEMHLVDGHPFVLEEPIGDQMRSESRFKRGECHGDRWLAAVAKRTARW